MLSAATDRGMNGLMSPVLKHYPLQHTLRTLKTNQVGESVRDTDGLLVHTECSDCEKPLRISAEGFTKTKIHLCRNCGTETPTALQSTQLEQMIRREEQEW